MATPGEEANIPNGTVLCEYCGDMHVAEYSHEGQWEQGHIYAVVCDDLTAYYTVEGLWMSRY